MVRRPEYGELVGDLNFTNAEAISGGRSTTGPSGWRDLTGLFDLFAAQQNALEICS